CRQVGQGSSAWSLLGVQPFRGDELRKTVANSHDPLRGMDLPVVPPAQHDKVADTFRVSPPRTCLAGDPGYRSAGRSRGGLDIQPLWSPAVAAGKRWGTPTPSVARPVEPVG